MFKKIFSIFAALTLSVGLWAETVPYRYPEYIDGDVTKGIDMWLTSVKDATPITSSSSTWGEVGVETWLVVSENVTISQRVTCDGEVHLILADDVTLNATQGITVSGEGNSLTIYAQTEDIAHMGQLIADAASVASSAGIGGGMDQEGSNITINGGIVTATGGEEGAGIGGGQFGSGSNITINGGEVTATGGIGAAGIGGGMGESGSNITINSGTVTANGGEGAAGIGGGNFGSGSNITINGGKVTATGIRGAGIGGGVYESGSNITINSGTVTANGGEGAAGIGGGAGESGSYITINGGIVTATGADAAAGIGGGNGGNGSNIIINGGIVTATGGTEYDGAGAGIGGGYEGSGSNITINGGTIAAVGGSNNAAGIGGGIYGGGSYITINGGEVMADGGEGGAGIGSGAQGSASNITINGGTITATGGTSAAGIGGGIFGSGSNIYISDAYVLKAGADADNTTVIAHSSAQDLGSTLTQQYAKVQGLATPYTRSMTIDNWATVCLPYASTVFSGAKFYRVNYYDGDTKLYIEEVSSLVAGQPYIFQATAETVTIEHAGVATLTYGEEQKDRGLQGLFARTIIATDGSQAALSNNAVQWLESDLEITVPACRAYFDMNNVPTTEQSHSAPLRCIRVPRQTPTDFENVTLDEDATKILRNGQLIIIRDGKEYNAQGMQL